METHDAPIMYGSEQWVNEGDDKQGTFFVGTGHTPRSDAIGKMERILTGVGQTLWDDPAGYEQEIFGAITQAEGAIDRATPDRMPSSILAMMKLAEAFPLLEGDVYQAMICPIDLGLTNIDPSCKDKVLQNEVIDFYDAIDMQECADINWLYTQTYGQGFPTEVWDKNNLTDILYPNPKHVHIGTAFGFGIREMNLQANDKLQEKLKEQKAPPMWIDTGGMEWNEYRDTGLEVLRLNMDVVTHLHVRKFPHNRYAIPPIARAYRTISTRQVLESMIRATIEGIMNQLWLYTKRQGEKFMRGEVAALEAKIQMTRGDKTGHLVWPDLEISQFIPMAIDQLIANEKWLALTHHIFRQLGINIYLISGERTGQVRGDPLVDVKVFMARIEQDKRRQLKWIQAVTNKWVQKRGEDTPVKVRFQMSAFDAEAMIRDRLMPLMTLGLLDIETALEEAGYDYSVILGRKEEQQAVRQHFMPQPSFAQVGPGGRQVESDSSRGRTPDAQNPEVLVKASIEDYSKAIARSFQDVKEAEDDDKKTAVAAFIATLMLMNTLHMKDAYRRGYADAGGLDASDVDRMESVVLWNNQYAQKFERDLYDTVEMGKDLVTFERRAGWYAPQGHTRAYMAGFFQARKEQDYTGWQRVLHPELSFSGPCPWCIADSQVIHSIEEPWEDHPQGVCTARVITFFREGNPSFPTRVPSFTETIPQIGYQER